MEIGLDKYEARLWKKNQKFDVVIRKSWKTRNSFKIDKRVPIKKNRLNGIDL